MASALSLPLLASHAGEGYGFVQGGLDSTVDAGIGVRLSDDFSLRASVGHTQPGQTSWRPAGSSGLREEPDSSSTASLIADWFPVSGSGFRLSAGTRYRSGSGDDLVGLTGNQGSYELAGHSYAASDVGSLKGRMQFNKLQPYLGLGWESAPARRSGWHFMADVGLNFETGARVSLASTVGQDNSALQQDLAATRQQLAHDEGGTRWRLAGTVGVAYSF